MYNLKYLRSILFQRGKIEELIIKQTKKQRSFDFNEYI